MAGPAYGAIGQADAPPPYGEPVYQNVDGEEGPRRDAQPIAEGDGPHLDAPPVVEGEGTRLDAPPGQQQHDPVDGGAAHFEQVNCNVT